MDTLADMLIDAGRQRVADSTKASHRRKLTKAQADEIRTEHARGATFAALARRFGINVEGIKGIIDGRYYTTPDRPADSSISCRVTWAHAGALPDSDIEVMVATREGEVFPAYWDDETACWRDLTAMPLPEHVVTHWCDYPKHPTEA
jgi:hypothetical protein